MGRADTSRLLDGRRRAATGYRRRNRERWEQLWRREPERDPAWAEEEPPSHLVALVRAGWVPRDAALDLGCGPGAATAYLATMFRMTIGLDVAWSGLLLAKQLSEDRGTGPHFVLAESPSLPLRAGAFSFVHDHGCLQHVARRLWPAHFQEVARLLRPGGALELSLTRPVGGRISSRLERPPSRSKLESLAGGSLELVSMEDFPFQPKVGPPRIMTDAVFRRR